MVEARNPHRTIGVDHTAQHLSDFTEYRRKLLTKTGIIREHAPAAARIRGAAPDRT
ncbi:hypothetical protein ACFYT4_26995 [Streptomyces sp. NPDC004609]|uniref:hypothetical protein n=1 Tax=Streptomyces sp. NPDC004609 TaxID=3364704 RepID=UPI0036A602C6